MCPNTFWVPSPTTLPISRPPRRSAGYWQSATCCACPGPRNSAAAAEEWIPEADTRLTLYVRLSRLVEEGEIDAFEEELADRFGPLPDAAAALMAHVRLRHAARAARVARIDAGPSAIAFTPRRDFGSDPAPHGLVARNDRLLLVEAIDESERADRVQALLEALAA